MKKIVLGVAVGVACIAITAGVIAISNHDNAKPITPATNEEKMKIVQEVLEGKRDKSDLAKHGIQLGERQEVDRNALLKAMEEPTTLPTTRTGQ